MLLALQTYFFSSLTYKCYGTKNRLIKLPCSLTPCSLTACAMGTAVVLPCCSRSSSCCERPRQARMAAARSPWARRRARRDREQGRWMGRETVERLEKRKVSVPLWPCGAVRIFSLTFSSQMRPMRGMREFVTDEFFFMLVCVLLVNFFPGLVLAIAMSVEEHARLALGNNYFHMII